MSLLSIISLSSYIDKLSSLFMAIGRAAPRYQAMALLYPRFKKLQSYLAEHFILVVKLCHYLFKYEQKSTVRQLAFSLWKCSNLARSSGERKPKCEYLTSVPNTTTKQHGNRSENLVTHRSTRKAQSKSVLLANIVDDLNLSTGKGRSAVVYFFCKYDVSESLQSQTIIGSLVRQLLSTIPDLSVLAKHYEEIQNREASIGELFQVLF